MVDSGGEDSVAPPGLFPGMVSTSPISRSGRRYSAANGARILNLGQQRVSFDTVEGHRCGLPLQVDEVERPDGSAATQGRSCTQPRDAPLSSRRVVVSMSSGWQWARMTRISGGRGCEHRPAL